MKTSYKVILALFFMGFFSCKSENSTTESTSSEQLETPSEEQIIESYIYSLSRFLVIRQENIDIAEENVDYNRIKFNEPGRAEFVNPNLDVAYLETWFAVDENNAVLLEIPKIEGRYYTAQIMDEWAEIIYNVNERNFPDHPYGKYVIALKGSNVEIPEGALRLDIPSKKAKMLARVELKKDKTAAIALQKAFKVSPLGNPIIAPAIAIPEFTNTELIRAEIFEEKLLREVFDSAPDSNPHGQKYQEEALEVAKFVSQSAENKEMVSKIIAEKAFPAFGNFLNTYGDKRGGWSSTREYLSIGEDIWFHALVNFGGIWWNSSSEVVYYTASVDSDEKGLDGDNVYIIHYAPEDLPSKHVNAFWSLTMLSTPEFRVIPNELQRYNLNSLMDFNYEKDGSLKLYLASELPDGAPKSNWLPSPKGQNFSLTNRFYVPKPEVLSGDYYVPPIQKQ